MLTKSDFLIYLDAPRHLWAAKRGMIEVKELNAYVQHLLEQGYEVEKLAEEYIQKCLIPQYKAQQSDILIQSTYIDGDFEARPDVLIRNPLTGKWDMFEIKSSTSVKKAHQYDATFQALIFQKKYDLGQIHVLHLNGKYIREGEINLSNLFVATNITEKVRSLKDEVNMLRYKALEDINEDDCTNVLGCIKPRECLCSDICHLNLPEYSIYDINYLSGNEKKIRELEERNIINILDIPHDFKLSEKQRFQVSIAQSKQVVIDIDSIKLDLKGIKYPLHFIDYESFNPAVPIYNGYKPYDQMSFQWSLHIQKEPNGDLEHFEFIELEKCDPIQNFLSELSKRIKRNGSIIVWNKTFEGTQNKRMGQIHPEFAVFCEDMNTRMYDLMDIFKNQWYADPKFKGSFSIKKVLPVLVPELSYEGMSIAEGATAMASWNEIVYGESVEYNKKLDTKNNLLKYCELDTLAMIKIFEAIQKVLSSSY